MKSLPCLLVSCCLASIAVGQDVQRVLDEAGFSGGVMVHLGCQRAERTLELAPGDSWIVQALDTSAEAVRATRRAITDAKADGRLTAARFDGTRLPCVDNMANLLVVDDPFSVPREETLRVLRPGGVLMTPAGDGRWLSTVKPWPEELDEWTHYQHDPAGTMVGRDRVVGPPRRTQWIAEPKWLRNHEFMAGLHAMVSSSGRVFYILDEGLTNHIFLPPHWTLIARDAFNGAILWKRPIKDWQPHNWPMKSGPGHLPRRLVAVGDMVYVTLGFREPVTALDAVTGKTMRVYEETRSAEEIILADGMLYALADPDKKPVGYREELTSWGAARKRANTLWGWTRETPPRTIVAVDASNGHVAWKHTALVAPQTMVVGANRVFYYDGLKMTALDRKSGDTAWVSEDLRCRITPTTGYTPRTVVAQGVVLLCHNADVRALSADAGKLLWQGKLLRTGHNSPNDLFVINDLVWSVGTGKVQKDGTPVQALDLHTGQVRESFTADNPEVYFMHQRCYPGRATERFLITSGTGTEFLELGQTVCQLHHYVRGSCIYGLMPCNGLLYKPPDSCACHYQSKVTHLCALAPGESTVEGETPDAQRFERGPAHGAADLGASTLSSGASTDWPTYRHDAARSGRSPSAVPANLARRWETMIGGKLTAVTIGRGKAFVASIDEHTLYAVDTTSGHVLWKHLAGGRIDSPPTIHGDTVLFGSADGWAYCLRAGDGAAVWRYRVAPGNRMAPVRGQLESLWPLHGSILVHDNVAFCLAGRNMFFDGGMRLVRLDATSGRKLSETVLNEIDPTTGLNLQTKMPGKAMPPANPDVLSCDGEFVYMGAQKFDLLGRRVGIEAPRDKESEQYGLGRHLFCPTGFLDEAWFHRSYWIYGRNGGEGHGEYVTPANLTPSGRLLVFDDDSVYGFRSTVYNNTMSPRPAHFLFSAEKNVRGVGADGEPTSPRGKNGLRYRWMAENQGILANALSMAGDTVLLAGPPDVADEGAMFGFLPGADDEINRQLVAQERAWQGGMGARLRMVSAGNGAHLSEFELEALPVWDGMAVADGAVFLALRNGQLVCLGEK